MPALQRPVMAPNGVHAPARGMPRLRPRARDALRAEARPVLLPVGRALRRVLETDSLGPVLALHWFRRLFGEGGD